jgi:hypothetical protein
VGVSGGVNEEVESEKLKVESEELKSEELLINSLV